LSRQEDGMGGTDRGESEILDRFFDHYYRHRPVNSTFTGVHDFDGSLPDWSPSGIEATVSEMESLRAEITEQLDRPDPDGGPPISLSPKEIDLTLAGAFLEIQIAELEGAHFQRGNPALYTGEAVFGAVSLMLRSFAPAPERVQSLEARLEAIPRFLKAAESALGSHPMPRSWKDRALDECVGARKLFDRGVGAWCQFNDLSGETEAALLASAAQALNAFDEFGSWIRSRPDAEPEASGAGEEFYDLLLSRGHSDTRSRAELLEEVTHRFEEEEAKLTEMTVAVDRGGWNSVADRLGSLHPQAADYLSEFGRCWQECKKIANDHDLVTWPDYPIEYSQIPEWAAEAAPNLYFLNYRSPAPLDDSGTHIYLAPPLPENADSKALDSFLRAVNYSVIKLNHVVHHGALGHHVQNYYAGKSRSRIGQVAAVDGASRIGMFCGGSMAEGWACYATDLMGEVGFLSELELIAEQHSRLRQLARAIVDINLHQRTWSEKEAQMFWQERIGAGERAACREITRTSMFPGTAIMYWLGTQGIHDLRKEIRAVKGAEFNMRSFNDEVLSYGSIPVQLIARLMVESNSK